MATLYVSEYANVAAVGHSYGPATVVGQAPLEPPLAEYTVPFGSASAAFQAKTTFVRLHADAICSVAFGASPSASTTNKRMAANQTEYFGVPAGLGFSVSVVSNT